MFDVPLPEFATMKNHTPKRKCRCRRATFSSSSLVPNSNSNRSYAPQSDTSISYCRGSFPNSLCLGKGIVSSPLNHNIIQLHDHSPVELLRKRPQEKATANCCSACRGRHLCRTATTAHEALKISPSRILALLFLCYVGMASTSSFMSAVAAAASIKAQSALNKNDIVQDAGLGGGGGGYVENDVDYFGDIFDDEDENLDDIFISDFDDSLEILAEDGEIQEQPLHHNKLKVRTPNKSDGKDQQSVNSRKENAAKDSVIILSAVDGTLAGISRTSGRVLWKQSKDNIATREKSSQKVTMPPPMEWNKFLSPLVSTTTSAKQKSPDKNLGSNMQGHQWQAVPSIDGTVYLTSGEESLSTVTDIRDLVDRAPFVDAHQRFFVGSRRAMVAAVDERTGEILRVIPKWQGVDNDGEEEAMPPSLEGRDVLWIGRLEHTVTVHDLHKGTVDIEFSVAEILSVDEMIHGSDGRGDVDEEEDADPRDVEVDRLFTDHITKALRNPSFGDRILQLPAPDEDEDNEGDIYESSGERRSSSISQEGSPFLVSTPSGNVAFRDSDFSSTGVGWVSFDLLNSPVVYAIEASSGRKIRVTMLPDDIPSSSVSTPVDDGGRNGKGDSLPLLLLEQQIASLEQSASTLPSGGIVDKSCDGSKPGECRAVGFSAQAPVVGALENGVIYALPLGERIPRPNPPQISLGLPLPGHHHNTGADNAAQEYHKHSTNLNSQHAIGFHEHHQDFSEDSGSGDNKVPTHLDAKHKQSCTPSSPLYPGCLIGVSLMMGNLLDVDGDLGMRSVFESSGLDYDLYVGMLEQGSNNWRDKNNSLFQKFTKIMSSWIAPTVALLFVVSFEIGRRERIKAEAANIAAKPSSSHGDNEVTPLLEGKSNAEPSTSMSKNHQNGSGPSSSGGVIQLTDEILGYGGHGTIVYRGVLERRDVAVKRLLSTYHASADREISLLIESDGHPNVVRYFLKEMRGDFVYLALELCNMSLNDLIVSLSKLRNARKDNFQLKVGGRDKEDFEKATKSLLFQIASGVRHIHSLRIVHRDLKPQNILLALSKSKSVAKTEEGSDSETEIDDTTRTTCSDTNTILESFKNREYVPKISDMGLGKQLAGQSSFGISTLGTGSVGGGDGGGGPGAGSVGWQAPEVMAMRWSPELSSSNNEGASNDMFNTDGSDASPQEVPGSNMTRTSRSVDIFSLGCIFYCTILPGSHPFGEWYEREANIMKNTPNKDDLDFVSPDASDLILRMINRDARARPTAAEVCEHPFFWSLSRRLKFLCELSDRIELCDMVTTSASSQQGIKSAKSKSPSHAMNIVAIEKGAVEVFGTSWEKKLDPELVEASLSRRTYDPSSVRDCLRMIRNKHHHYDELPAKVKSRIGSSTDGLSSYIMRSFPRLLMHCYHFCVANLAPDDSLVTDYELPVSRYLSLNLSKSNETMKKAVIADLTVLDEAENISCPPLETIPDDDDDNNNDQEQEDDITIPTSSELENKSGSPKSVDEPIENSLPEVEENPTQEIDQIECTAPSNKEDLAGIVVWSGSNTAKDLNCRGWYRSEDEWVQRIDTKLRSKRDTNLTIRCASDPKFRTRLCNHWDVSGGTFCPMRKKNKCIFAHGPIELRVKEGKRKRWGTLVNKTTGLCANPRASGGEDTYGAARSIEKTRKELGQWNTNKKQSKKQSKGGKQQTPKKKKEQKPP